MKQAKADLRRKVLALRDALTEDEIAEKSHLITQRVLERPALIAAEVVLLFASFGSEVRTLGMMEAVLDLGKTLVLPRVPAEGRLLELRRVSSLETDLQPGKWRIPEPVPERCPLVQPGELDFVVCPSVAYDLRGNRLGYGGGFYDRLFALLRDDRWPEGVIGPAFEVQIVDEVPVKDKDVPIPYVATEERLIVTGARR